MSTERRTSATSRDQTGHHGPGRHATGHDGSAPPGSVRHGTVGDGTVGDGTAGDGTAGNGTRPSTGLTRIMLRPLASSLPLAFFAFGLGTILLTASQLSWVPLPQQPMLVGLALAIVAPLQFVGGIVAFLARDAGSATALMLLAALWTAVALVQRSAPPGTRSPVLAVVLLTLAPMLLVLALAAAPGKPAFAALLLVGCARFVVTACFQLTGVPVLQTISGWAGIALAAFAVYGGAALLLEATWRRPVLPIGRMRDAQVPAENDLGDLERAQQEPGVRRQL